MINQKRNLQVLIHRAMEDINADNYVTALVRLKKALEAIKEISSEANAYDELSNVEPLEIIGSTNTKRHRWC
jgi:predicted RND superfamily exporter protein